MRGDGLMKRRLPLGACLKASIGFVPRAYVHAWAGLLLTTAVLGAPLLARLGYLPANAAWIGALWFAALVSFSLMRDGALYRLAVSASPAVARARGLGPAGLQFSRPEVRLLAAGLLVTLFLILIAIAGFVVSLFVASAAGLSETDWSAIRTPGQFAALGEPWKLGLVLAAPVGAGLVLLILAVQLLLSAPATIGRERVVSIDALALAQGNALPLIAGLAIVGLPTIAVAAGGRLSGGGHAPGWMAAEFLVAGLVQAPLTAGFLGAAYRALEYVKVEDIGGEVHG